MSLILNTSFTMKKFALITLLSFSITASICFTAKAQTSPTAMPTLGVNNPWTKNQLMEPSVLASIIRKPKTNQPLILNIGAVDDIKDAIHVGAVSKPENLKKLNSTVQDLPKNTAIVIYCACCPFAKCPNIRPAFIELEKAGFTNVKVLNLPTNLKVNWSDKGYPLAKAVKL